MRCEAQLLPASGALEGSCLWCELQAARRFAPVRASAVCLAQVVYEAQQLDALPLRHARKRTILANAAFHQTHSLPARDGLAGKTDEGLPIGIRGEEGKSEGEMR